MFSVCVCASLLAFRLGDDGASVVYIVVVGHWVNEPFDGEEHLRSEGNQASVGHCFIAQSTEGIADNHAGGFYLHKLRVMEDYVPRAGGMG